MKLYEKHNYLNSNIKYIKNGIITEYDMKNGGISILYEKKLITDKEYNYLMNNLNKEERNVTIGKWLKENKNISKELMNGFKEARKLFFELNNIKDEDVLSIKKDAIFLINRTVNIENINDNYCFRQKNQYTSYINILKKEFYYSMFNNSFEIKGFTENVLEKQENFLFNFVKNCLVIDSNGMKDKLFIKLLEFKDNFINNKLDFNYYYDIIFEGYLFKYDKYTLLMKKLSKEDLLNNPYFNKSNNLKFIIELISILLS